jgi:hypothetical protein
VVNTLVTPSDLEGLTGSPFDGRQVDIAVAQVRADAGWHIAPVVTETIVVNSYGGQLLVIPSRRVVGVAAVRDVTGVTEILTSWVRMSGGLYRRTGWPVGTLEVDLTHGYTETPLDLLPVVADYVRAANNPRDVSVASRSVGQVSETYRDTGGTGTVHPTVARYAVPGGVA